MLLFYKYNYFIDTEVGVSICFYNKLLDYEDEKHNTGTTEKVEI